MNFIKKYLKRRKQFALIDAKIKSPVVRELLKTNYAKNLGGVVENYDETPYKGVRLALYSNPSKVHWYDTKSRVVGIALKSEQGVFTMPKIK